MKLEVYEYVALKEYDEIMALRTAEKKGVNKGIEIGAKKSKNRYGKIYAKR